ncbi:stage VI sporulation protein F [Virgibacillus sp. NKC19-3]|uniref:stage VI sporulation protein F n=1 Tax=Virgibacillus saliphilus TaxID=2831674 RepID=UPI001C9AE523|nr:stage VI sporulation protein F [Virgibacillus sp. NKC19-3]MBY7143481.1 stage VI sporulation protein F [Virgibacillus sp. NKC19-3]
MNKFQKDLFDKVQQNANINPDEVYKVANSVKNADFSDEKTVRQLVRHLSKIANKPLSKEKEDKIVHSIIKNNMPMDAESLSKFFGK